MTRFSALNVEQGCDGWKSIMVNYTYCEIRNNSLVMALCQKQNIEG